ncbi:MAG: LacI family DNA-binding transcriptional regulator [Tissierellaceae bacterium]|nr:LacI family DNA-binding transcriptional regulator [Tissierellaceae bacterium]
MTIKEIADIAGVSRGTVDRVLNNRGNVNPETENRVKEIAQRMGYRPNRAARALATRKNPIKLGFVVPAEGNSFFDDVIKGLNKQAMKLVDYGVSIEIRTIKGFDVEKQLDIIEELINLPINGLIITPIDDEVISKKLKELSENGIPVITTNSDISNANRLCYVGSDYYKGGATAAGLMKYLIKDNGKVGIITGSLKMLGHRLRVDGFIDQIKKSKINVDIVGIKECNDDNFQSYEVAKSMLTQNPDIEALFIAAGGTEGICEAVKHLELGGKLKIICFDLIPSVKKFMKMGLVDFTISQDPEYQGWKPVELLYDYLVNEVQPQKEHYYTKTEINIAENI